MNYPGSSDDIRWEGKSEGLAHPSLSVSALLKEGDG